MPWGGSQGIPPETQADGCPKVGDNDCHSGVGFLVIRADDGCLEAGNFICHLGVDFWAIGADDCPRAGDFICHLSVDFSVVVAGSSASSPPKLRTASSSAVGMWSRGMSLRYFSCILSESEVLGEVHHRSFLGGFVAWVASGRRLGALVDVVNGPINVLCGPGGRTLLDLPKILFACSIPFDIVFIGQVVKSGGQLLLGGIHFMTDIEMLPSIPQLITRLSLLGC